MEFLPAAGIEYYKHMEWMSKQVQRGRYLYCPNGSHLAEYDDQQTYFTGLVKFIRDVDTGRFTAGK